ncbi:hypothetical protein WG915_05720 [Corynebacterium sp. H128]|uniref:hypothetical protein n=1 Tax=Corynebacterium sp. H128 TaxID=3133427 RepID=UPI00309F111B
MKALSLATVFAALSGFAIVIGASHLLGTEVNAQFMAIWGLFFACTGLIDGLTQETTRAVSASQETGKVGNAKPLRFAILIGIVVSALIVGTSWLWMDRLVEGHTASATALLTAGLLSYAFQALLSGLLSGLKLWEQYAGLLALDSGIRMVLMGLAWWFAWGLPAFLVITVIGALSWAVILFSSPRARAALSAHTDVDMRVFRVNAMQAMLATGATAILITGFPTAMKFTLADAPESGVTMAGLMFSITLTRAPILVPLQRFQSALIVNFVERREALLSALARPVAAVLGVGMLGAVAAWLIGPWILHTFFKPDFFVPGSILAILTFASACTGSLMITSTAALATELYRLYIGGWILASIVAFGILLLPLSMPVAVCAALLAGPISGAVLQVVGLLKA